MPRRCSATASGPWHGRRRSSRLAWGLPLESCRIKGKVVAGAFRPVERLAHADLLQAPPLHRLSIQVERMADGLKQGGHVGGIEYETGGAAASEGRRVRIDHRVGQPAGLEA